MMIEKYWKSNCDCTKCLGAFGNNMLHYAALRGHIELVRFFLDKGFDPNERNNLSETPLHLCAGSYIRGKIIYLASTLWKNQTYEHMSLKMC